MGERSQKFPIDPESDEGGPSRGWEVYYNPDEGNKKHKIPIFQGLFGDLQGDFFLFVRGYVRGHFFSRVQYTWKVHHWFCCISAQTLWRASNNVQNKKNPAFENVCNEIIWHSRRQTCHVIRFWTVVAFIGVQNMYSNNYLKVTVTHLNEINK